MAPFRMDVWLIPKLVIASPSPIAADHSTDKVGIILIIIGGRVIAYCSPLGSAPRWGGAQAYNEFHALRFGHFYNLVVLVPGGTGGFVAAIFKVPFAMNLNILPGEFL